MQDFNPSYINIGQYYPDEAIYGGVEPDDSMYDYDEHTGDED